MSETDFTKIGIEYDKLYRENMSDLEEITLQLLNVYRPNNRVGVCDIGAGTGLVAELLKTAGWDFDYLGIEPSGLYNQLKENVGVRNALNSGSEVLKSYNKHFDVITYSKSLHEIIISNLLLGYNLSSNGLLHNNYLENPKKYHLKKQENLTNILSDSFNALNDEGMVIISDMEYPPYLTQRVVDKSVEYVHYKFNHLNHREQTLPITEIELGLKNSLWRIVDKIKTNKRNDSNIKTEIYGIVIQKEI